MRRPSARFVFIAVVWIVLLASPGSLFAQPTKPAPQPATPPPPPPLWAGSIGAGLSFTSGNTDTSSINLAYEIKRDGGLPVVFLTKGLYIRGETDDELTVDKALLENRVDYRLTPRLSVFGQLGYLRDRFKEIDYLVSPTVGLSYLFIKNARVELSGDGSVGLVWEKNTGRDLETDGAVLAGERLTVTLSETARFFQGVAALWKMDDFEDALYTFHLGLAASLTTRSELKVELLDTYKNRRPTRRSRRTTCRCYCRWSTSSESARPSLSAVSSRVSARGSAACRGHDLVVSTREAGHRGHEHHATRLLHRLRPVTFRYIEHASAGPTRLECGLIAEEVVEVSPDLVVRSTDGSVEAVQYQKLAPMLLTELQRQHREIEGQRQLIERSNGACQLERPQRAFDPGR